MIQGREALYLKREWSYIDLMKIFHIRVMIHCLQKFHHIRQNDLF